jgi:Short C-terminal domain
MMSDTSQGLGWWQASDGKWYAPEVQTAAHPPAPEPDEELDAGKGQFGDGVTKPLYEFKASRFKGGRMFTPNVIRVWPDRIEEYEHHAVLKKGTETISFHQLAQVKLGKGLRWADVTVESTGGHVIALKGLPKADGAQVKGLIDNAVNQTRSADAVGSSPTSAATTQSSVADELLKLAQLRDSGVLSPEEFEEQKARAMQPPA